MDFNGHHCEEGSFDYISDEIEEGCIPNGDASLGSAAASLDYTEEYLPSDDIVKLLTIENPVCDPNVNVVEINPSQEFPLIPLKSRFYVNPLDDDNISPIRFGDLIHSVAGETITMDNYRSISSVKDLPLSVAYESCPLKQVFALTKIKGKLGLDIVNGVIKYIYPNSIAQECNVPINFRIVRIQNRSVVGKSDKFLQESLTIAKGKVTLDLLPEAFYDALVLQYETKPKRRKCVCCATNTDVCIEFNF